MKLAQFVERHPYRFAVILEVAIVAVYLFVGTAAHFLDLSNLALYGLANLGLALGAIVLLTRLKWWQRVGFNSLRQRGDLRYFLIPLVPAILNLIPGAQRASFAQVSVVFVIALLVAFAEETIFRGLMLQAIKPFGYWRAALITAALFGLIHAMNALTGKSGLESALQIGYATAIGFAYAALTLKKEVLWLLILTHFLTDFAFFIQKPGFTLPPFWQSVLVVILTIGFSVYGIFVMRQKSDQQIGSARERTQNALKGEFV